MRSAAVVGAAPAVSADAVQQQRLCATPAPRRQRQFQRPMTQQPRNRAVGVVAAVVDAAAAVAEEVAAERRYCNPDNTPCASPSMGRATPSR
jgi:hypothetical protein